MRAGGDGRGCKGLGSCGHGRLRGDSERSASNRKTGRRHPNDRHYFGRVRSDQDIDLRNGQRAVGRISRRERLLARCFERQAVREDVYSRINECVIRRQDGLGVATGVSGCARVPVAGIGVQ